MVRVATPDLSALAEDLLKAAGATPDNARIVVHHLLEADAMGLSSHGIIRIPQYLDDIAAGGIAPAAEPTVTPGPGAARAAVDGGKTFGQVAGMRMTVEAIRIAGAEGAAMVVGHHMGHTGRIGAYAEAIARAGCIGIVVCAGPRSGHFVAPFGGLEGRLATNPIAYAFPSGDGAPTAADFSTSVVPEGVIRSLRNRGLAVPDGALRDAEGRFTNDPANFYSDRRGAIQPLGGDFGYRGTALSILVEILATLLPGEETTDASREGSNLAMMAIRVDDGFAARAARMNDYLRSSPPIDPARPVMLPGERERQRLSSSDGTTAVDDATWEAIIRASKGRFAIPAPVGD